jgi:hypothetical protein
VKAIGIVAGVLGILVAAWWGVEMALLKASRYRLAHGDGREHSFRRKDHRAGPAN